MNSIIERINGNFEIVIGLIFLFSIALMFVEFIWEWTKGKLTKQYLKEIGASMSVGVPTTLMEGGMALLVTIIYIGTYENLPFQVPINWWTSLILLLLVDFIHYWTHRWEHEIRLLWTHHSVHHSSPIYNYSTAFRVVFTRSFFDLGYYFVLVLVGFHPVLIFASLQIVAIYQFWLHTQLIRKIGFLEKILMTPSHHRVHHGSQIKYLDKNYGALFILWDKLFGTFQKEEEEVIYGLTTPINTTNPLKVHFYEYINLFRDLTKAKNGDERKKYLFRPPGWTPNKDK